MSFLFIYSGYKITGEKAAGKITAETAEDAKAELERKDIVVVEISQNQNVDVDLQGLLDRIFPPKVKVEDLIIFCRQMNALTRAGVPIMRALKGLGDSVTSRALKDAVVGVRLQVDQGTSLAVSMQSYPRIFGSIFVSMIDVGENTGKLDAAFTQVASYLDLERETKKRLKQATRYPSIVVSCVFVAVGVINVFVIPAFAGVFEKFGAELPLMTKILIASSNFTTNYWWLIIGLGIGGTIATKRYINTVEGRLNWDRYKLKIPLLGSIFERIILARFARVFSMLSAAGIPILASIMNVSRAVGNAYVENRIVSMHNGIERGDSFLRTATASTLFTPLVLQMIAVGEETGQIDEMLEEVADFYEQEVDYDLKKLADAIEPILLVIMGGIVLVLALGVFLPMWDLGSAAQ